MSTRLPVGRGREPLVNKARPQICASSKLPQLFTYEFNFCLAFLARRQNGLPRYSNAQ